MDRGLAFYMKQAQRLSTYTEICLKSPGSLGLISLFSRFERCFCSSLDNPAPGLEFLHKTASSQQLNRVLNRDFAGVLRGFTSQISFQNVRCLTSLQPVTNFDDVTSSTVLAVDTGGSLVDKEDHIRASDKIQRLLKTWDPSTIRELEALQVSWNPFTVCHVLKKLKRNIAWKLFKWLTTQKDYCHNVYTYTAMIDKFGKAKMYDSMDNLVEEMRQEGIAPTVVTYTALIHWYRLAKNLEGSRKIWKEMEAKGCRPNVVAYTVYIDALGREGCSLEAMEVFKDMHKAGCRPDIYTYTVLMQHLVEAGKLDAATNLFDKLGEVKCKPNCVTFSVLIGAHAKAGNTEKVLSLYEAMSESGVGTSFQARALVARALETIGKKKEAEAFLANFGDLSVLQKIEPQSQYPDEEVHDPPVTTMNTNTTVTKESGQLLKRPPKPGQLAMMLKHWGPETEKVLEVVGTALKPPYVMNVLKVLRKDAVVAWRFFQWTNSQEGYKHTHYTYGKIVEVVGRAKKVGCELMEEMMAEFEKEEMTSTVTFNALIKVCAESRNTARAQKVFNRMKAQGCEPDDITYTMLIDMFSRTGNYDQSMEMYNEMRWANCRPTMHTFTVVIHSLAKSKNVREAEKVFNSMPSLGFEPNVVTYTALMQAFLLAGEVEEALKVFQQMKDAGVEPTRVTLKILSRGLHTAGRKEEADKVSLSIPYMRGTSVKQEIRRTKEGEKAVNDIMSLSLLEGQVTPAAVQVHTLA